MNELRVYTAGIVSEELQSGNGSYIAASYVKYIESAGGQVVPILYPPLVPHTHTLIHTHTHTHAHTHTQCCFIMYVPNQITAIT